MGHDLYREVLDHAPANITSGERIVWAVLADFANDDNTAREARPGMELLSRRAGLSADGVGKALRRLAARGFELRVAVGKGQNGQPIYAYEGVESRYRLPELCPDHSWPACPLVRKSPAHRPREVGPQADHLTPEPGPQAGHSMARGRPTGRERSAHRPREVGPQADPSPQEPSKNPHPSRALHRPLADLGATAEEEKKLIEDLRNANAGIQSMNAYLASLARSGDLQTLLDDIRSEAARTGARTVIEAARQLSPCEHGQPGGDQLHPMSHEPLCPLCRKMARASA